MKKELNPVMAAACIVVLVIIAAIFFYRGAAGGGNIAPGAKANAGPFAPGGAAVGQGGMPKR